MAFWGKIFTLSRLGSYGVARWIAKHYYLFILLLIIIPKVIGSVHTAIETHNILHPLLQVGLNMINADAIISEDVKILISNPTELIGMLKPTMGIWNHIVYYFNVSKVWWKFLGNIWLITIPFVFIYRYNRFSGRKGIQSSKSADLTRALIYGILFILFVNMAFVIYGLMDGSAGYVFSEGMSIYQKMTAIFTYTIPFHGLYSLLKYLSTLIL